MRTGRPREGKELNCPQCNKLKYFKNNDIKRGRRFCSHLCSTIWWKGKPRKYKDEDKIKRVLNLGTRMLGKKHSKDTKIKMSLAQLGKPRLNQRGEKNYNWKGGLESLNHRIRESLEMKLWKRACLERDDFTDAKTGQRGGKLRVHHINNFADYPELRTSIENGITFSDKTHREFHKKYGVKNNTREQLLEFLDN